MRILKGQLEYAPRGTFILGWSPGKASAGAGVGLWGSSLKSDKRRHLPNTRSITGGGCGSWTLRQARGEPLANSVPPHLPPAPAF